METTRFYQQKIKSELEHRIAKNSRYSLTSFAKALGIGVSTLSRILSGEKRLTPETADKILANLPLGPLEKKQFLDSAALAYKEQLVQRINPRVKKRLMNLKDKSNPPQTFDLTVEVFKTISDWYHYAILQLMNVEGFKHDFGWISRELGISHMEAKLAIERMVSLGILEIQGNKFVRLSAPLTTGDISVTSAALKKRIKQVTDKSVESLTNDPIEKRNHTTMTMAIDPELLPLAKEMIQDFMDKLYDALKTNKKHVYELQVNLFPIQRIKK